MRNVICYGILVGLLCFFTMNGCLVTAADVQNAVVPMVDEKTGTPLPAGGGDPGKAYFEFDKAIRTGNVDTLKKFAPSEKEAAQFDDPQMKKMLEVIKAMRATGLKITKGFSNGNRATLFVQGTDPSTGGTSSATVRMVKVGNSWKIEKESWEATTLPEPGKASSATGNKAEQTMTDMRSIAKVIAEYGQENNMTYPKDETELVSKLVPKSLKQWPMNDAWGHAFKYLIDPDSDDFLIISYGADGKPDKGVYGSNGLPLNNAIKTTTDPNADIIFEIDFPLQYPELGL